MVRSNEEYLSNSLEYVYKPEIGQRIQYTANTGTTTVVTANSNLDGSGTLYTVFTANSQNGALIKTITIKGQVSVSRGMIRLYIVDTTPNTDLIAEIEIPPRQQGSIMESFAISVEVNYMLKYQYVLKASTQNGQKMTITAEGLEISFP